MYKFDNLKLVSEVVAVQTVPIVILHSGGLRVLEAMALAESALIFS